MVNKNDREFDLSNQGREVAFGTLACMCVVGIAGGLFSTYLLRRM